MAVLRIAKMGNPALLQKAAPVADPRAPEIARLAQDMQDTIEDIGASGLAAPQVFVSQRVVVYRMIAARIPAGSGLQPRPWTVMVNPEITPKARAKALVWERCLSVPGLHGKVPRYRDISITYSDLEGRKHTHEATSSWAARVAGRERGNRNCCNEAMRGIVLIGLAFAAGAAAQTPPAVVAPLAPQAMQPGYGVVERVAAVRVGERSAAAGGSSAAGNARPVYRLAVRMADGSLQYRDIDRPEFRPGDRVLLTNAGDVVPD